MPTTNITNRAAEDSPNADKENVQKTAQESERKNIDAKKKPSSYHLCTWA